MNFTVEEVSNADFSKGLKFGSLLATMIETYPLYNLLSLSGTKQAT